jgi:hypothetical protein
MIRFEAIPLHTHTVDEVVIVDEGVGEAQLGDDREEVSAGSVVFVPAGVAARYAFEWPPYRGGTGGAPTRRRPFRRSAQTGWISFQSWSVS